MNTYLVGGNLASRKHDIRWGRVLSMKKDDSDQWRYLVEDCCVGLRQRLIWVDAVDAEDVMDFCPEANWPLPARGGTEGEGT